MNKILRYSLLNLLLLPSIFTFGQSIIKDLEIKGSYLRLKVEKKEQMYFLEITKENNDTQILKYNTTDFDEKFLLNKLTHSYGVFFSQPILVTADIDDLKSRLKLIFYEINLGLEFSESRTQEILKVTLNKTVPFYLFGYDSTDGKEYRLKMFNTKSTLKGSANFQSSVCTIIFEDGFIKTIVVAGTIDGKYVRFTNNTSIGASTINRIKNFSKTRLFNELDLNDDRFIWLSDILAYERLPEINSNDLSPANQKVELKPEKTKILSKEANIKLFSMNIYSDFYGINQDNPNGLIQTELSKRLNLYSNRYGKSGIFTHFIPFFEISKIEENNRTLSINKKLNDQLETNDSLYINYLQAYRYKVANVGVDLNIYDYQGPVISTNFNIIGSVSFTRLKDTFKLNTRYIEIDENLNSLLLGPCIKIRVNPQKSFSFEISDKFTHMRFFKDDLGAYNGKSKQDVKSSWINTFEMLATLSTDEDKKVFARFRINNNMRFDNLSPKILNDNFLQFQLGYSTFLKYSSKVDKK